MCPKEILRRQQSFGDASPFLACSFAITQNSHTIIFKKGSRSGSIGLANSILRVSSLNITQDKLPSVNYYSHYKWYASVYTTITYAYIQAQELSTHTTLSPWNHDLSISLHSRDTSAQPFERSVQHLYIDATLSKCN